VRNIKDTIGRADAFKTMAEKSGATIKTLCWTIGRYDVIAVFEAPDDESAAALSFSVASLGSVRNEILRALLLRRNGQDPRQDALSRAHCRPRHNSPLSRTPPLAIRAGPCNFK
jgi:uncharacterized protein with GYD domain